MKPSAAAAIVWRGGRRGRRSARQRCGLRSRGRVDGQVAVRVFPHGQKSRVRLPGRVLVAALRLRAGEAEMRERVERRRGGPGAVIDHHLKVLDRLTRTTGAKVRVAAYVIGPRRFRKSLGA